MDLTQLEMFNAVATTGSITQAAQKVHRVPSNLTTRIRQPRPGGRGADGGGRR